MNIRVAIVLSGSLLVGAAGGVIAALPVARVTGAAPVSLEKAPSPDLEVARQAMLASLRATTESVAAHAFRLELLAARLADAGQRLDRHLRDVEAVVPAGPVRDDPVQWRSLRR